MSPERWSMAVQIYARYAEAVDRRRWADVGALFAESAVSISGGKETIGRSAIVEKLKRLMSRFDGPTQHAITNVVLRPLSSESARIRADFTLLSLAEGQLTPLTIGTYEGELVWGGSDWELARQSMQPPAQP